jgi:pimeloyl-ACP methyl ester carboxylesterase/predicted glycosyltransferase
MRARYPDHDGYVEIDGVKAFYEVFGDNNSPTILFTHGWNIGHSELWKMQVAYLSRHYRVIKWDYPGNGRSDRPEPGHFSAWNLPQYIPAILEATGTEKAILVGLSWGAAMLVPIVAATRPDLVEGMVLVGGMHFGEVGREDMATELAAYPFMDAISKFLDDREGEDAGGWETLNEGYFGRDYRSGAEFFMRSIFPEPHSTKAVEDGVGYAMETTPELVTVLVREMLSGDLEEVVAGFRALLEPTFAAIDCPALAINGDLDAQAAFRYVPAFAEALGAELLVLEGSGHCPQSRDPVRVNHAIREFVDRIHPPAPRRRTWSRAHSRAPRALYVSSPIGLGHAARDLAIANELRALRPDLQIDWLTQHPVTQFLESRGERVHPACDQLASESAHLEAEAGEHDLHAFQALRRMDEILCANFGVFDDLMADQPYDLVIADEAWDIDYFLHENPELKRSAFCWLTDFVGFLPMADGGAAEAALCADYNAEMIGQRARYRRLRDASIFVGGPDDVIDERFGDGLPAIREWMAENFSFAGYVSGFDPAALASRDELRAEFGWGTEPVAIVAVGGSGVGGPLLRRIAAALPAAARAIDGLRTVIVTGPRIDPHALEVPAGVEVVGFVPELHRLFAAADLGVVQGGLTTTMELTALNKPFVYFPLAHHFEQQLHVRHRLERHRAGLALEFDSADPDAIAEAMASQLKTPTDYVPVDTGGAARAAALIAGVL